MYSDFWEEVKRITALSRSGTSQNSGVFVSGVPASADFLHQAEYTSSASIRLHALAHIVMQIVIVISDICLIARGLFGRWHHDLVAIP